LRDSLRQRLERRVDLARVREGCTPALWAELAEAGVFSLRADGFGWVEVGIAFQELGRALVPGPIVWSHLAYGVVEGVVGGIEAPRSGEPAMIEHRDALDALVVLHQDRLVAVAAPDLDGGVAVPWPLDPLTPVCRVAALPAGEGVGDADTAAAWRRGGALLTAAYQVGMAEACAEQATAYALDRRQFNRPIGSFQAVKHLLADMAVRAEVARTAVDAAACVLDDPDVGDVDRAVGGAKVVAGDAALANAKGSLQVHGGMGFTWELAVHLYLKRAWVLNQAFGSPDEHAEALAS
jgi:alkylation response protein AidB-like acyl-CoA dehydrogenase